MKDITIKIWPEVLDYLPALIPIPNIENKENSIYIDFSNCTYINSSGLNILLIQILKIVKSDELNRGWSTNEKIEAQIIDKIIEFHFFKILSTYSLNIGLFKTDLFENLNANPIIANGQTTSFPIYMIDFKNSIKRRDALNDLKSWVYGNLENYYNKYDFILPQLISVITEIAKNSADHSDENAFIGLDVIEYKAESKIKIKFSIGDLGVGINQNIKNHLPESLSEKRYKFWDLTQTYREALSRGFTTRGHSMENKGLGMSLILDGSKGIDLKISVFDANSRGILSNINSLTHSDIRKNFFNTGKDIGFFYFGELEAYIN